MEELEFYVNPSPNVFKGFQASFTASPFIVIGVPFDSTSTYRAGSRFAPRAIREASINIEGFSWRTRLDIEEIKTCDLGDVNVVQGDVKETLKRVERVVKKVKEAGKIPILIGGEHTITYGAMMGAGKSALLCFDAHLDMRDEYPEGVKMSHATFMRRLTEAYGHDSVILVGVRAACREEVDYVEKKGVMMITSMEVTELGALEVARKIKAKLEGFSQLYISVDLDVLDPAYAPGVSNPEPEGLTLTSLLEVLNLVIDRRIVGLDVVEVCPPFDNGLAAIHAAKLLFEEIAYVSRSLRASFNPEQN